MIRIQRQRTKGWRMPEGAIYVGRPSRYGNPFSIAECGSAAQAVELYKQWLESKEDLVEYLAPLRGARYLACWCRVDQPCHADLLIEKLESL